MGLEDFFENNRSHPSNYGKQNYHHDHDHRNDYREPYDSRHSYPGRQRHFDWTMVLLKIRENKKLKMFVIVASIVILAIVILLAIVLLPVIVKIFTYLTQLDLKGLLEYITSFLDKLLKGQ